jgi:hypothetical protein
MIPGRIRDLRLLYPPSIAASKLRIVSKGRSHLLRVGFERSGSAGMWSSGQPCAKTCDSVLDHTDRVPEGVLVLDVPQ